ncbi:MAG: hypothetical protein ABIH52_01175 [Candidatus Aenigmatarchaeota archaeon]|nr:hypothetical protein [Nanoarchaeota archaeon]
MGRIETTVLIVLLLVVFAVGIPERTERSAQNDLKNDLDKLRDVVSQFYDTEDPSRWPTYEELRKQVDYMDIENPFQDSAADSVVLGDVMGTVTGTRGGWVYNPSTGEIWPNTNKTGENQW